MERACVAPGFATCGAFGNGDAERPSVHRVGRSSQGSSGVRVRATGTWWCRTLQLQTRRLSSQRQVQQNSADPDASVDFHDPPTPNDWTVPGSSGTTSNLGVVLTHVSADFDTLSSAVGLAKLRNHQKGENCTFVVLPRGASPGVAHFVQLHKNKFPIREKKAFPKDDLKWVGVVDAQRRDRLADCATWIDIAKEVVVLDHHVLSTSDIDATELIVESVGATATVVAEMLQKENVPITEEDATLLGLGIHADTGSLTFEATTPRDAKALAYCLEKGASQKVLAEYCNPSLTSEQRDVIAKGMRDVVSINIQGLTISRVHVECQEYTPGMAQCAKDVLDLTDSDVLLMAVSYVHGKKNPYRHVSIIGRAKPVKSVDLSTVLKNSLKGGGHPKAASAAFRMDQELPGSNTSGDQIETARQEGSVEGILDALVRQIVTTQIPPQKTARDVMRKASRVISCPPDMTMGALGELLDKNDHRSCPVISKEGGKDGTEVEDAGGILLGVVSITEVDVAAIKGQLDRPVSGYMKLRVAVTLDTPVSECEKILVEQGEGCIPVVENFSDPKKEWRMAGLVTRATILKTHEYYRSRRLSSSGSGSSQSKRGSTSIAEKFPPGLAAGEKPKAPRVTFDEHLFFSQDELDKVDVGKGSGTGEEKV